MEILIVGVILVGIMAYVSTKIKNTAKLAYEQEIVENNRFTVTKPEGFIIPVKPETHFAFEAYSKEYGEDETDEFNQCSATIREKNGNETRLDIVEGVKTVGDVKLLTFRKALVNPTEEKSFELEVAVLPSYKEQYLDRINLLLQSFRLN